MSKGRSRRRSNPVLGRLQFERGAAAAYPTLRATAASRGAVRYTVVIDVPFYESRVVTITIAGPGKRVSVRADGPTDSPHRYSDGDLCMWVPTDPAPHRWEYQHGLLDLLDATRAHLFREAWWREHGEWLGPELAHGEIEATLGEAS